MLRSHPAALGGFLLDIGFIYLTYYLVNNFDAAQLPPEDREMFSQVAAVFPEVLPTLLYRLALQLVGLVLIELRVKVGFIVALLGTLTLLPVSVVYGMGCLFTFYKERHAEFPSASAPFSEAPCVFFSRYPQLFLLTGACFAAATLLLFSSGAPDIGGVTLVFCGVNLYLAGKARYTPVLALYDTFLSLSPDLLGKRIELPYEAIQSVTLLPKKRMEFSVLLQKQQMRLQWSLQCLSSGQQQEVLQVLSKIFRRHGVVLR